MANELLEAIWSLESNSYRVVPVFSDSGVYDGYTVVDPDREELSDTAYDAVPDKEKLSKEPRRVGRYVYLRGMTLSCENWAELSFAVDIAGKDEDLIDTDKEYISHIANSVSKYLPPIHRNNEH